MRTARVFCLFLSVLQFIFFLKLVEYVRGEEIQSANAFISSSPGRDEDGQARGMFIAPNINRKKPRTHLGKSANASETDSVNVRADKSVVNGTSPTKREQFEKEVARLCPACENNQCLPATPIGAGFPIVPIIVAVITGIAWFILFLIFWIFHTRPNTKRQSDGYGGYDSPQPEYGADIGSDKPSIFDHFMKPDERSMQSYTRTLYNILDSIEKLTDLYNSS